jgi:uncharacterized protein (DUF433 family)
MQINRIAANPNLMNDQPCIRNLCLTICRVLELLTTYPDREELHQEFPELKEDNRKILTFISSSQDITLEGGSGMASVPPRPKIYHITHLDNLPKIASRVELVSDANRMINGLTCSLVGMSTIKQRRLNEIEVSCYPGTKVGQYVPFYFCPRSIMLYILHMGNHPDVSYKGGQGSMIHLQADFHTVIEWANSNKVRWAFSNGNAGAYLTTFYNHPSKLSEIDWTAVSATDFRDAKMKEGKQAEFLMFDVFPWTLIDKIGTINSTIATKVQTAIANAEHQPTIAPEPSWYF